MTRHAGGLALISVAVALAAVITMALVGILGPSRLGTIHDRGSLPNTLGPCGRTYDLGGRLFTRNEISKGIGGAEPPIVEPSLLTACPRSPREFGLTPADVWTAVFVRVGEDEYAGYGLQGGP